MFSHVQPNIDKVSTARMIIAKSLLRVFDKKTEWIHISKITGNTHFSMCSKQERGYDKV